MSGHSESQATARSLAAEARWTGHAVGGVGASVAVLSVASGGAAEVALAGLALTVFGAATALIAQWRMDREIRRPSTPRAPGRLAGAMTVVRSTNMSGALQEPCLESDLQRAVRLVSGGSPNEESALAQSSVLIPVTVFDLGSGRSWERVMLCLPEMLVLLREENLRPGALPGGLPMMIAAREYESCAFWLPEHRGLRGPARNVGYMQSPDGDIYMALRVSHRGTVRFRFRCSQWPPGAEREMLWRDFERLTTLVTHALGQRV